MPTRRKMSLAGMTGGKTSDSTEGRETPQESKVNDQKSDRSILMTGSQSDKSKPGANDDDEEVALPKGVKSKDGKRSNITIVLVAIPILVIVIIAVAIIFGGRGGNEPTDVVAGQINDFTGQQSGAEVSQSPADSAPELTDQEISESLGVGTQNFAEDTTMETDPVLTDAEEYTKDIYGLTTRIDYSVDKILDVTDFVEYEKHRGTWGGGLELYWLEASYKGAKYVVQVPFKYYKELDDEGIVPVKMEVLTIDGEADGDDRTVISYMCLDEDTLESVMKTQAKATGN